MGAAEVSPSTVIEAGVLPATATSPQDAARLVERDGAAIAGGIASLEEALAFARARMGDRLVRLAPQFEATTSGYLASLAKLASQVEDRRGRVRRFTPPDETMVAHNDGYGFGDLAPDQLFLWCETPDPEGGDSWLVDGAELLRRLESDAATRELARFCWEVPVDHSEPGFIQNPPVPIARRVGDRVQVRNNPYFAPVLGDPLEAHHEALIAAWWEAVEAARAGAPRFHLRAGQLLCVDNFRVLHGRDAYRLAERKVVSIWGWTSEAMAVPEQAVSIV